MSVIEYRIKVKRGDFELEVQGDKEWVESKYNELIAEKGADSTRKAKEIGTLPETVGEFLEA